MKKYISVPKDLFLQIYKFLVLYGLLHEISSTEMYNTFLKNVEELLQEEEDLKNEI